MAAGVDFLWWENLQEVGGILVSIANLLWISCCVDVDRGGSWLPEQNSQRRRSWCIILQGLD